MIYNLFVIVLLFSTCSSLDISKICSSYVGYYLCLNETTFIRCEDETIGSIGACDADMLCLCGRMSSKWSTPCGYDFATLSNDCEGNAGDFIKTETDLLYSPLPGTALGPTNHVPLSLFLQDPRSWPFVLSYFLNRSDYDSDYLYQPPTSLASCPFHSQTHKLVPTQFFLGLSDDSVLSNEMSIRVPDKMTAMFLAFSMDYFGINPSFLMGLSSALSGVGLIPKAWNITTTIVETGDYWCTSKYDTSEHCQFYHPLIWTNGPFQLTANALSLDISAMTEILGWTDLPIYASRHWFQSQKEPLNTYHASLTQRETWRSVLSASVHSHVLHTLVSLLPSLRWGDGNEYIEAIMISRLWESSLNETQLSLLQEICVKMEEADNVLDFPIYLEDVITFIRSLHDPVEQALFWRDESIDWSTVEVQLTSAFEILGQHRSRLNPELDYKNQRISYISLQKDWRLLLAIIRAYLPPREPLIGASVGGLHKIYGPLNQSYYQDHSEEYPSLWCSTAGGFDQLCQAPSFIYSESQTSTSPYQNKTTPSEQNDSVSLMNTFEALVLLVISVIFMI